MDEIERVARGYEKALDRAKEEVAKLQAGQEMLQAFQKAEKALVVDWERLRDGKKMLKERQEVLRKAKDKIAAMDALKKSSLAGDMTERARLLQEVLDMIKGRNMR